MFGTRHSRERCFKCYFHFASYVTLVFFVFNIAVFIFWVIFLPQELKFTVNDAKLTKFNLATTAYTNKTLHCNLSLDIFIRNHNKKVGVHYGGMFAVASFGEQTFALASNISFDPFYLGHANMTMVRLVFEGTQSVVVEDVRHSWLTQEMHAGVYNVDVELALEWIKARYGKITTGRMRPPKVFCQLKIPLITSDDAKYAGAKVFNATDCEGIALPLIWP